MTEVIFENTENFPPIPLIDDWRSENGRPTIEYLRMVAAPNAQRAKEFEIALNSVCAFGPIKKVKISWKIELVDD
jgi:hypothetical protein